MDNIAYLKNNKHNIPQHFTTQCDDHRYYSKVFITTPWENIYHKDNERLENFSEAIKIFDALKQVYGNYAYFFDFNQKDLKKAFEIIDKGIEILLRAEKINPKDFIVLNNIAHTYTLMENKTS
ncbi:AAA family ATPase [bacterium]|nr:AAA family ATPase [bacterium]